ncbi:uncharacterized protein sS8_3953 [Methylocaldum marinum]|uniref:Transposase n=2 Tax=Methylocaldum marinum TaxID=1432792 RepID=A0A250KW90_9GAMM|nr:uncharacterized protein sS8_3953 [Methylocaldum marinum]
MDCRRFQQRKASFRLHGDVIPENHPHLIESEAVIRQKADYIHQTPVKRGYVNRKEHWRYSSARNYAGLGKEGLI